MFKPCWYQIYNLFNCLNHLGSTTTTNQGEPERVTANVGENVILNCAFDYPEGIPVSYVIQWQKLGIDLPIYIW